MHLSLDAIDVELIESTPDNEDQFGGRWGWFWHERHMPVRGPFRTPPRRSAISQTGWGRGFQRSRS